MIIHITIVGILLLLLSLIHIWFPRVFKWKSNLKDLSLINRQMMYVHTFFIGLILFLMSILCLYQPVDLMTTSLGHRLCTGLGIFWAIRLVVQLFIYSSALWKGKNKETLIHILFVFLWMYLSGVFFWVGLANVL